MSEAGKYIVIEGHDGVGKSTNVRLLTERLESEGVPVEGFSHPGHSQVGKAIREILKDADLPMQDSLTEAFLSAADTNETITLMLQTLEAGTWAVSDRSFYSAEAYQGYGRGVDLTKIHILNNMATRELKPDLLFILDTPEETRARRVEERGEASDRFESEELDFLKRVRQGYKELAHKYGGVIIKATFDDIDKVHKDIDEVHEEIWGHVEPLLHGEDEV